MSSEVEVAIVGGGPAGLSLAIGLALRQIPSLVLEARPLPCDKACGEGLMPSGVRALARLGALPLVRGKPLQGVRYLQEDGSQVEAPLPSPGLGVRRTALIQALDARAQTLGVPVLRGVRVKGFSRMEDRVGLDTTGGRWRARLLVACDGAASRLRQQAGLEVPTPGARRYGMRGHFRVAPWSSYIEVHWAPGVEAYVTPVDAELVGVAFLFTRAQTRLSFAELLGRFPRLSQRLSRAPAASKVLGAGPLRRAARRLTLPHFALLGDAAGYIDALTGEGLSLALLGAEALCSHTPDILRRGASAQALGRYQRAYARLFRRYAAFTEPMLWLSGRPDLRRAILRGLSRRPQALQAILRAAYGV